jgi:hypothetical protein
MIGAQKFTGFNLEDILIKRSPIAGTPKWVLHIEMNGYKYTGYFDGWDTFLLAFREAVSFFAFKAGKINTAQANEALTRKVAS